MIWWEVMPGPRKRRNVHHVRRYHAHRYILETVFHRWPPAVIGLGPPSTDDEPIEWVAFMRAAIFQFGSALHVPVVLFDTDQHVAQGLGVPRLGPSGGLKSLIRKQMPEFSSNKRRVILATATAMAGAVQIQNTMSREERVV